MNGKAVLDKAISFILYFVCMPFVAVSFCLTPLTNDTRIFIAVEAIADKYYSLPYGWDAAYEVKPIGNRIVNWVLYKAADFFVPFTENHYAEFGIAVKATALLILVVCLWYVSKRIQFPYSFPFLFIAFAGQANFGIMMSEWFASLFALVAIAMCLEKNKPFMIPAGALCLGIALLKSITVLMVFPIICAVYLLGGSIEWKRFGAGYVAAGLTFLVACLTIWPYSIADMLMSRLVAHVGMYDPVTLLQWFWRTQDRSFLPITLAYYIPVILIGMVVGVVIVLRYYANNDRARTLLFAAMWLVPILIVLIQSEFIIYHYIVLMVPAIISVVLFAKKDANIVLLSIVVILAGYILINSAFGSFTTYEYTFWQQKEINADAINGQFNLTNQTALLYLDPGDAPYYFHANSSCHYICPMPVERSTPKWNMSDLPQFKETKNCILNYQGEYIVTDIIRGRNSTSYFGAGILHQTDIMDMIVQNYTEVDNRSWVIYKKR